jgi:hypothetical protein
MRDAGRLVEGFTRAHETWRLAVRVEEEFPLDHIAQDEAECRCGRDSTPGGVATSTNVASSPANGADSGCRRMIREARAACGTLAMSASVRA